jgi:non-specific serine/threonine protein kinase/serine/threonine-protein kinase
MEYVDGRPITDYSDENRLSIEQRLELFQHVCASVQYAHGSLIVHRDLKPSNILVTRDGEVKLLDFGIAHVMGEDEAGLTRTGQRVMTPAYASPEQVRGEPVTTASDVYSLGVLVYEILADARPYETHGRSLSDAVGLVCESLPAPPSRRAPLDRRRELVGDLDRIVAKALHKEPAARYATVAELGDDLRRHLDGFPVQARPDGRAYRAAKFLRRHRVGVPAAAVALTILVASVAIAVRQARVAEAERRRAEARFEEVHRLAGSVLYDLHDAIASLSGSTPLRRVLVARSLEYLDRLAREAPDEIALKRKVADGYERIAEVQGGFMGANLGDTRSALERYDKALAIRRALVKRAGAEPGDIFGLALLELKVGAVLRAQGHLDRAGESYRAAAAGLESLRSRGALEADQAMDLSRVYQRLSELQGFQGRFDLALPWAEKAVAEAEPLWKARPADSALRSALAFASCQLASVLGGLGRHSESLDLARRTRGLLEEGLRDDPIDAQLTSALLYVLGREGRELVRLGDLVGALASCKRSLQVAEEALARDPADRWTQMAVEIAENNLGQVLLQRGDSGESIQHFRRALHISNQALAADPQYSFARLEAASAEFGLGRALVARRTPAGLAEGCALVEKVRVFWTGLRSRGELPPGESEELEGLDSWLKPCGPGRRSGD